MIKSIKALRLACTAAAAKLLCGSTVFGGTYTWTGSSAPPFQANDNWSNPINWSGFGVPASANTTDVFFENGLRLTPNQDLSNPFLLRSMIFDAPNFNLAGLPIAFDGAAAIQQNAGSGTTISISNPLVLQSNTTYDGAGDATLAGIISGTSGLTKNGPGKLTLSAANTYSGTTQLNAGILLLQDGAALQNSTLNIGATAGVKLSAPTSITLGDLTGAGNWNLGSANLTVGQNNATALPYTGRLTSTGDLKKVGTGVLSLGGVGSSFNALNVNDGSLLLRGGSITFNSLDLSFHPSMTVQEGATLDTRAVGGAIQGAVINPSTLTITGAGSKWRAGPIIVGGAGVDGGALIVDAGGAITDANSLTVQAWTKFTSTALATVLIQNGGTMTVAASFLAPQGQYAAAATVTGPGSLWTNTDRLELGHAPFVNSYGMGRVTVSNGGAVVTVGDTKFLSPTSSITVDGGTYTTGSLSGDFGAIDLTAASSLLTINAGTGTSTFSGSFTGAGNLVKSGGSTQVLNGALSYTGITTVNAGTLNLSSGGSHTFIVNGGTLQVPYSDLGTRSFKANPAGTVLYQTSLLSGGFLRGSGFHDLSGVTRLEGTTLGTDVSIDQNQPLSTINVTAGGILNNNAPLTIDGFQLTSAGQLNFNNNATIEAFESAGQITIGTDSTVNNVGNNLVLGAGSRSFIGEPKGEGGRLILRDATTLQLNGALLVNNGTIDGPTSVNFGSLAKGAGRYGDVIVTDGGKFSPGNSPGTVTTGATTWNSGGTYVVEIGDAAHDLWLIDGQLNLHGSTAHPFTIFLASLEDLTFDNTQDYTWPILHASGGIVELDESKLAIDVSGFHRDLGSGHFSLQGTANELAVHFSAVPEPAAMAMVFAVTALFGRRRRGDR